MVPIKQILVPSSKYSIKCPYAMVPEELCVHNTANDASAINEVNYMISNNKKVSYHYAIDDKMIVQAIPENRNAFHAGDGGKGRGNRKALSIEICYSKSGGKRFTAAEKNAAEFCAHILKKYGWGIDKLKKHQDYSGKYCPHRTLDMGWDRFVKMVEVYLDNSQFADLRTTHWGYDDAVSLYNKGIVNGVGGNRINPNANITRAEISALISRSISNISTSLNIVQKSGYCDVPKEHWAYNDIDKIKNIGIISMSKDSKFRPNDQATRAEVAIMIRNTINYFNKINIDYKKTFTDVTSEHWAYTHINDLYNMGIVTGYSNGTFMPNKKITRIETIVLISRMMAFLGK